MENDPVKKLIEELGSNLLQRKHSDIVLNNGKGRQFEIKPSEFIDIAPNDHPRKIAFIDGGSGPLYESPNFLITINRAYFSIFKGSKRIKPKSNARIQFFTYVTSNIQTKDGKKKMRYDTRIFTHSKEDTKYLPLEEDLTVQSESTTLQVDRLTSLGRKFAELQFALHVIKEELESGDMLVMDGSLQIGFENETKYANRVYDAAVQKGVIVCGLSKTSRLITESGDPLLARIAEIAEDVTFGKWYVKVAEEIYQGDRGFILAAKFHEKSPYIFRFEILREQFNSMSPDELNSIMYSIVANSQDVAMIGYPYGAIDADRFAQVRLDEINMYRGFVLSEMLKKPEWKKFQKYIASLNTHDVLNKVSS